MGDANITFSKDSTIGADNDGNEWLSGDERAYWHDQGGYWVLKGGESAKEVGDDAVSDGLTVEYES